MHHITDNLILPAPIKLSQAVATAVQAAVATAKVEIEVETRDETKQKCDRSRADTSLMLFHTSK